MDKIATLYGENFPIVVRPMTDADIEPSIKYLSEYIKELFKKLSPETTDYIIKSNIQQAQDIINQLRKGRLIKGRNPVVNYATGHIVTNDLFIIYEDMVCWEEVKPNQTKSEVKKEKQVSYSINLPWKPGTKLYGVSEYCDEPVYRIEELYEWDYSIDCKGRIIVIGPDDEWYEPNVTVFSNKSIAKSTASAMNKQLKESI